MKPFAGLLLIFWFLLPGVTLAETIGVRSGDHDGFTRLVLQLRGREDWKFGRVDGGFEFRPAREDISYRLTRVFDKIGRGRISDVRDLGDGRLYLAVDCACHAVVDELNDGQVVLDIVNGPAPEPGIGVDAMLPRFGAEPAGGVATRTEAPDEPGPLALAPVTPVVVSDRAGLPLTFPGVGARSALTATEAPKPQAPIPAASDPGPAAPAMPEPAPEDTAPAAPMAGPDDAPDRAERIAKTESALLEQVARAAAQGLLDADLSEIEDNVSEATPTPAAPPRPVPIEPPAPPVTQRGHITVETSVDRAVSGRGSRGGETEEGDSCIDPALFDIIAWGGDVAQGADIGAYRSRVVSELDVADGDGVTELVRNYVFITFGAEAKALMRRYPDSVERSDILFAMAEIMDDGRSESAGDLADQMSCEGATALWATLAQPELRPGQPINLKAVTLSFGALPVHLRRHLGPGLADKLLTAGHREAADLVHSATDRIQSTPTSEQDMLAARFEMEAGAVEQATEILDDVVAAGDAVLPEALLQRVEATLATDGAVPDDIVLLLDSLAFQFRGTATARQMVDAGIRARVSRADFPAAFAQLEAAQSAGLFTDERNSALNDLIWSRLTRDTDDTSFLRLSLVRLSQVQALPVPTRRATAERLLDLGFAGPARAALGTDNSMPGGADRQLLARAALLENNPAVAIGYLAGLTDPPALAIQAEALDMARDHAGAMRVYDEAGNRDKALQMAWLGGLWPEVSSLDEGPIGAAARLMTGSEADPLILPGPGDAAAAAVPGAPGLGEPMDPTATGGSAGAEALTPLAQAEALIARSETTRATLNALLEKIGPPTPLEEPGTAPGM